MKYVHSSLYSILLRFFAAIIKPINFISLTTQKQSTKENKQTKKKKTKKQNKTPKTKMKPEHNSKNQTFEKSGL